MNRILNASQLASQPTSPIKIESRQWKAYWAHIINLSPYVFELQDEGNVVRTVVPAFRERSYRLRLRAEYLWLEAIATVTEADPYPYPSGAWAVYGDIVDVRPEMVGNLVT